jgi:hypothetical protein
MKVFEEVINFGSCSVIEYRRNEYFNRMHPFFNSNTPSLHYSVRNLGKNLLERLSTTDARIQHFRK